MVKFPMPSCAPIVAPSVSTTRPRGWDPLGQERVAPATRDEADVHALRLGRGPQPERGGVRAHLGLRELAHRQQRPGQLALPEHVEDVRLVLGVVGAAREHVAAVRVARHAVVAGGDGVEPERVGTLEQAPELHRRLHSTHGFGVCPARRLDVRRDHAASNSSVKLKT